MIHLVDSSWIESIGYKRSPNGERYLVVFVRRLGHDKEPEAILYGKEVPSYLPGLLCAGLGGKSIGKAYHKLVRGKGLMGQKVMGKGVYKLKEMMK